MGLAGYYRRFIEGLSKVAHAITSLQKKGIKFEWTVRCEESFQQLKSLLTSAPVLKVADPERDFLVCTDACGKGLGGVLEQGPASIGKATSETRNSKEIVPKAAEKRAQPLHLRQRRR